MIVILIMLVGVVVGNRLNLLKFRKANEILQLICTWTLIFCMGVSLGNRENFFEEIKVLGMESFLFAVIPVIFSVIFVYVLTKKFMK